MMQEDPEERLATGRRAGLGAIRVQTGDDEDMYVKLAGRSRSADAAGKHKREFAEENLLVGACTTCGGLAKEEVGKGVLKKVEHTMLLDKTGGFDGGLKEEFPDYKISKLEVTWKASDQTGKPGCCGRVSFRGTPSVPKCAAVTPGIWPGADAKGGAVKLDWAKYQSVSKAAVPADVYAKMQAASEFGLELDDTHQKYADAISFRLAGHLLQVLLCDCVYRYIWLETARTGNVWARYLYPYLGKDTSKLSEDSKATFVALIFDLPNAGYLANLNEALAAVVQDVLGVPIGQPVPGGYAAAFASGKHKSDDAWIGALARIIATTIAPPCIPLARPVKSEAFYIAPYFNDEVAADFDKVKSEEATEIKKLPLLRRKRWWAFAKNFGQEVVPQAYGVASGTVISNYFSPLAGRQYLPSALRFDTTSAKPAWTSTFVNLWAGFAPFQAKPHPLAVVGAGIPATNSVAEVMKATIQKSSFSPVLYDEFVKKLLDQLQLADKADTSTGQSPGQALVLAAVQAYWSFRRCVAFAVALDVPLASQDTSIETMDTWAVLEQQLVGTDNAEALWIAAKDACTWAEFVLKSSSPVAPKANGLS